MKKVQTLVLTLALVALGSVSWAATNLNSSRSMQKGSPEPTASNLNLSKSNINRLVYETSVVTSTQATEILQDLDKFGKGDKVEEAKVREILQSHGVRADSMKEILYLPKSKTRELPTYILLTDPKNKPAAIAVTDERTPPDSAKQTLEEGCRDNGGTWTSHGRQGATCTLTLDNATRKKKKKQTLEQWCKSHGGTWTSDGYQGGSCAL